MREKERHEEQRADCVKGRLESQEKQKSRLEYLGWVVGVVLRLLIMRYSNAARWLSSDLELNAPSVSAACRREAFFLLDQGHSPFVHGQCSVQPPLLLATMRLLRLLSAHRAAAMEASLVLFSDLACAWLLRELSVSRMAGTIASLAFLLAPWSIAACAVRSTGTLASALLLFSAKHAARARCAVRGAGEADAMVALVALAMAIHLSPDMIWMVAPVGALSVTRVSSTPGELSRLAPHLMVVFFIALLVPCVCVAPLFGGLDELVSGTLRAWLHGPPLDGAPNIGLWWYFMAEVFLPLRPSFVAALHLLPRACVLCLAVRAWRPPLACTAFCLAVVTATKAVPTVPEIVASLAFVVSQIEPHVVLYTRYLPQSGLAFALSLLIGRPLLSLWLDHRELNANFFFASTLVTVASQLLFVYDVAAAVIHAEAHDAADRAARALQRVWRTRMRRALAG